MTQNLYCECVTMAGDEYHNTFRMIVGHHPFCQKLEGICEWTGLKERIDSLYVNANKQIESLENQLTEAKAEVVGLEKENFAQSDLISQLATDYSELKISTDDENAELRVERDSIKQNLLQALLTEFDRLKGDDSVEICENCTGLGRKTIERVFGEAVEDRAIKILREIESKKQVRLGLGLKPKEFMNWSDIKEIFARHGVFAQDNSDRNSGKGIIERGNNL